MGTTSKMSIPYPENSDFVADGATNMKDIADQVDVKTGLIKINPSSVSGTGVSIIDNGTISFSGTSAATIVGAFPNDFSNFIMQFSGLVAAAGNPICYVQLRTGSTTAITNYRSAGIYRIYGGGAGDLGSVTTRIDLTELSTGNNRVAATLNVYNPNVSQHTSYSSIISSYDFFVTMSGNNSNLTAYNDCVFSIASSTMSGQLRIYGYN